ncbi:MAG: c-type cytochrome [Motiliproteus sp.]
MTIKRLLPSLALSLAALSPVTGAATLESIGHIHNLTFAGVQQKTLLLGAHHGLYAYEQNKVRQISQDSFDIMGLTQGSGSEELYASGHPAGGGNAGLLRSSDGGQSFVQISEGLDGPVDFHHLSISPINAQLIYGVHRALQVSRDGGNSWVKQGELPQKLLKLTASGLQENRLYAASERGLFISEDSGLNWQVLLPQPTTTVIINDAEVLAFVVGKGLISASESDLQWREINNSFGSQVLLDLALSGDGQRYVGLNQYGALIESHDRGTSWQSLPAKPQPQTQQEKLGQKLFQANCQSCHGIEAVGETYSTEGLTTQGFLFAPALNGSMHGWHHTDEQLVKTILEGSPRTPKMPAWKGTLSEADALATITYLKTLWGDTQKRCQGSGHMDRNCLKGNK